MGGLWVADFCLLWINYRIFCHVCAGLENKVYHPTWFQKETDPITGSLLHVYNGKYWDCKAKLQWDNCPDIYL